MTTTARIAASTSYAIYDASISSGAVANFGTSGLVGDESIKILKKNSSGGYEALTFRDAGGDVRSAELTRDKNTETISGPVDIRIEKPNTANSVEVVEYT